MKNLNKIDKLYKLIRIAVKDLKLAEKNPKLEVEMCYYHVPSRAKCHVCFAGAVMAESLSAKLYVELAPVDFGEDKNKLTSLDRIRKYDIKGALDMFYKNPETDETPIEIKKKINAIEIPTDIWLLPTLYEVSPEQFKSNMLKIADWLETL